MKLMMVALLCFFAVPVLAQGDDFEAKYQEKLKKDFITKAAWVMKLDEAQAKAREQKKLIIGYFTRSYAP
ncbi:MAG: hypothetical protein EXS14_10135 [Planctomycetes bacterium]|nr:hypothetical protein [Planctomycetota bacterium]